MIKAWSGLLLGLSAVACGPTYEPPPAFPSYRVDVLASQVSVRRKSGSPVEESAAGAVRALMAERMSEMVEERDDLAGAKPARFKADVVVDQSAWPLAPCLVLLVIVGCPLSILDVEVDLTFEVDAVRYRGRGSYSYPQNYFYNLTGGRSVGVATDRALAEALADLKPLPEAAP
jgi:hypothetical protein